MSRRQQSKESAIFEPVAGLVTLLTFLWLFSPNFRAGIQIVFAFVVVVLLMWLAYKIINPKLTPTPFKPFTPDPHHQERQASEKRPTDFVEGIQPAKHTKGLKIPEKLRNGDKTQVGNELRNGK